MRIRHLGLRSASHLRMRILGRLLQCHSCKQRSCDQQQKELAPTVHPLSASSRRVCYRTITRQKGKQRPRDLATATAHTSGCRHSVTRNSLNENPSASLAFKEPGYLANQLVTGKYARPLSYSRLRQGWRDVPLTGRVRSFFVWKATAIKPAVVPNRRRWGAVVSATTI